MIRLNSKVEQFLVVTEYIGEKEGSVLRAISVQGAYLSQAKGKTVKELIMKVQALEEVTISSYEKLEGLGELRKLEGRLK